MLYAIVVPITPPCFDQAVVAVVNDEFHFAHLGVEKDDEDPEVVAKMALKNMFGWQGNLDRLIYFGERETATGTYHRFAYVCFPHERMRESTAESQYYRKPMDKLINSDVQMSEEHYAALELTDSYMSKIRERFERHVSGASLQTPIKKLIAGESMALFLAAQDNWTQMRGGTAKDGSKQIGRWGKHVVFMSKKMPPSSLSVVNTDGSTGVYQ
jgi:hypothetical protein